MRITLIQAFSGPYEVHAPAVSRTLRCLELFCALRYSSDDRSEHWTWFFTSYCDCDQIHGKHLHFWHHTLSAPQRAPLLWTRSRPTSTPTTTSPPQWWQRTSSYPHNSSISWIGTQNMHLRMEATQQNCWSRHQHQHISSIIRKISFHWPNSLLPNSSSRTSASHSSQSAPFNVQSLHWCPSTSSFFTQIIEMQLPLLFLSGTLCLMMMLMTEAAPVNCTRSGSDPLSAICNGNLYSIANITGGNTTFVVMMMMMMMMLLMKWPIYLIHHSMFLLLTASLSSSS